MICLFAAPNGSPLNLSTLITSSSSVTLQWSPPEIHLQNGLIQHYTVQLTEAQTGVLLQYTSSGVSLTINNLHPYYTYTCTVAAVTTAAGPGITVNFQLPQDGMICLISFFFCKLANLIFNFTI